MLTAEDVEFVVGVLLNHAAELRGIVQDVYGGRECAAHLKAEAERAARLACLLLAAPPGPWWVTWLATTEDTCART